MEDPCFRNISDDRREWIEKHEREVWSWVQRYEKGEEPDLQKIKEHFDKKMACANKEYATAYDDYTPPKIQAMMIYKTGAHKKSLIELLNMF